MPEKQARTLLRKSLELPLLLAAWTFALSSLITGILWAKAKNGALERLAAEFDYRSRDSVQDIVDRMETYHQVLLGVKGFMEGSSTVERERFRSYVAELRLFEHYL